LGFETAAGRIDMDDHIFFFGAAKPDHGIGKHDHHQQGSIFKPGHEALKVNFFDNEIATGKGAGGSQTDQSPTIAENPGGEKKRGIGVGDSAGRVGYFFNLPLLVYSGIDPGSGGVKGKIQVLIGISASKFLLILQFPGIDGAGAGSDKLTATGKTPDQRRIKGVIPMVGVLFAG
jgi:hypothetical protein